MNKIIEHLKKSDRVLIATHVNPDGDAIGSLIAMGLLLDELDKKTLLFNESPIPAVYSFLPSVNRIQSRIDNVEDYDTAIILDCSDLHRIGDIYHEIEKIPVIINLDHHVTNSGFGNFQIVDEDACATTEVIYRLVKEMNVPINCSMAASIYTGILADTGSFRFSNTNHAAFEISLEMMKIGVDPWAVAKYVYGTYSLGRIKVLNLALDSIEIAHNGKLSIMTVTLDMLEETKTHSEDLAGFINYARRIQDIKIAALIQEYENGQKGPNGHKKFHVSLRSDETIDVGCN